VLAKTTSVKISELTPQSKNVDLVARVLRLEGEKEFTSNRTGKQHKLAEFLIGDETATIIMTLWDEKIKNVEVGKTYQISNAFVTVFRGSMRLNVGKYGKIEEATADIPEESINTSVNKSSEKVSVPSRRFRRPQRRRPRRF